MPEFSKEVDSLTAKLTVKVEEADSAADELEDPEPEYDREAISPSNDNLDLDWLFSDL